MSEQAAAGANRRYDIIPWAAQGALDPVIEMESGEGVYFYDTGGKRYLDFSSQLVNVNLGYQHPRVVEAIREQAGRLCYIGPHHTTAASARSSAASSRGSRRATSRPRSSPAAAARRPRSP